MKAAQPMLAVFVDGLRPDALEHMPFLASVGVSRRIRTELGYSMTCHASMYTGVWPQQHLHWFIWQRDPKNSPFRWLRNLKADRLPDSSYTKYALYRLTHPFKRNSSFFSVPFPAFVPLRLWHEFAVTEKRFWTEPGFNAAYRTIFEFMQQHGVSMNIVGMDRNAHSSAERLSRMQPSFSQFNYLFFGDIDYVSHRHRHDSQAARDRLRKVDSAIQKWYDFAKQADQDPAFLLWSDHGHVPIQSRVDARAMFKRNGLNIDSFIHFVDANYIRFWFRDEAERRRVEPLLPQLGKGFTITDEIASQYNVKMPDNRYGDLIYYLDAPAVFDKGEFNVFGRKLTSPDVSMHGYHPDNPEVDGVLVTNLSIQKPGPPILQDIPPTILSHFGIPVPEYMVGRSLW